jgi:hypothetical protein
MIEKIHDLAERMRKTNDSTDLFHIERLKIAAMLILAEEIGKLATSNVSLSQAETDLATALSNLSTAITNAVQLIQSGNPQQAQQAADTMEAAAGELNTLSQQLAAAGQNPVVSVPTGGVADTGAGQDVSAQASQVKPAS